MLVTYLDHSGFCVELSKHILVFDYVLGELPTFDKDKAVYFFVSHNHQDHFHKGMGNLLKLYPQAKAIVSDDVSKNLGTSAVFVSENREYAIDELVIETFHSTDQGVAFLVEVEGQVIFHAGDLHWWHWRGEDARELEAMKQAYFHELVKLEGRTIDLAFLVLDPRLEEDYWLGFDAFMRCVDVRYAIPMHCWGQYELIDKFIADVCSEPYRNRILKYSSTYKNMQVGGK